jgi:hypothetical protein
MVGPEEFERAEAAGREAGPRAVSASYDREAGLLVVELESGVRISVPPRMIQGLETATPDDLSTVELSPAGLGLHVPAVDADVYIPALVAGVTGSERWMSSRFEAVGARSGVRR